MRILASSIIILLSYPVIAQSRRDAASRKKFVFEATVLKIGSPATPSGAVMPYYRLAKYQVDRVCEGNYSKNEIVVDHLSITGEELSGLRVGEKVCVEARASKTIDGKEADEWIREKTDRVKIFYIGLKAEPISQSNCKCKNLKYKQGASNRP